MENSSLAKFFRELEFCLIANSAAYDNGSLAAVEAVSVVVVGAVVGTVGAVASIGWLLVTKIVAL